LKAPAESPRTSTQQRNGDHRSAAETQREASTEGAALIGPESTPAPSVSVAQSTAVTAKSPPETVRANDLLDLVAEHDEPSRLARVIPLRAAK
jgi:hypothetical protein